MEDDSKDTAVVMVSAGRVVDRIFALDGGATDYVMKRNLTRLMQYSAQLYGRLEAETGQATEWKPVGSLRLASSQERWSELKRMATTARSFDFELHTLSAKEAQEKFPLITADGIVGAVFVPNDGSVEPSSLTMAYAKGARAGGVTA